jgi:RHS repeat-associated protein
VPSLTYDGTNRLTSWGGKAITYDANGNITNFGSATYTWNARNQLTATSNGSATFRYDALARRVSTSVSGVTTPYLYDGQNPAMISTNQMLAGAGLDEIYAQINSSGATSYLRDGLNSTVALTNSSAATTGNYSYSPYGDSVGTGTSTTPLQYTGRENDGATGLYYYRARYYSPQLGRFISEDPIGLAGGTNYYAYAGGDPISNSDPSGLLFGINAGEGYGDSAVDYWANLQAQTGNPLYAIPGTLAEMWTPCHSNSTFLGLLPTGLGGRGVTALAKLLPNSVKGLIGEGASIASNWLQGSTFLGSQVSIPGLTTIADSAWVGADGVAYYVESKFGTAGLTAAQRVAQRALGDLYQVERWGYDWVGKVGAGLGATAGGVGAAAATGSCGCR